MTPRCVDQLLAGYADGDAISQEARKFRDIVRELGIQSEIFAPSDRIGVRVANDCRPIEAYDGTLQDVVVYHYSIASPASSFFLNSLARKIMRYHNITPADFFDGFDDDVAAQLRKARSELRDMASQADSVWADSEFNATELREAGVERVFVMPLLFSPEDFGVEPDPYTLRKFGGALKNILFVGRIVPNKCVEELILSFAWLNRCIDPRSRFVLVGSERSCPRYFAMLRMLAGRLGLMNVCFEGFLSSAQLAACYRAADVFVCASRHEGYCLPLVEAMCNGVPVIAREAGGMPEAMGGAGIMFEDVEPRILAELIYRVLIDEELRRETIKSELKRVTEIKRRDIREECRLFLA